MNYELSPRLGAFALAIAAISLEALRFTSDLPSNDLPGWSFTLVLAVSAIAFAEVAR